jgi:hypothetical protein
MAKATNKTSATIGLYIEVEKKDSWFHVRANVVFVGLKPSEMADIDAGRSISRDVNSDTIRNVGGYDADESPNGLYLDSFRVNSQGNNDDDTRHLYAWEIEYRDVYSIDARKARKMADTLATVEKRMAKVEEKYGRPMTFGAYLLRVADAIGASRFVIPAKVRGSSDYRYREHSIRDLASGASMIDGIIRTWIDERIAGMAQLDA